MWTSEDQPIVLDWLRGPWTGRIGLTFAPGKRQDVRQGAPWDRDLHADVARLSDVYGVSSLVSLIEDHEFVSLGIEELPEVAARHGIAVMRMPIPDGACPPDVVSLHELVERILLAADAGGSVAIHCRGGLGRAGTVGGCVLRAAGFSGEEALAEIKRARGDGAPQSAQQHQFVREYAPLRRALRADAETAALD